MKEHHENYKELAKGAFFVVLIGVALVAIMSMVLGRSPLGDGSERRVYKTIDGEELDLWIYKPRDWNANVRQPCVLWFFGGAWKVGTPEQFAAQSRALAKRGIVSITAEYRVKSRHGSTPFDSVMDARSAMRWIKVHSGELGIDPDRIAVGGGSSGGQLALACEVLDDLNDASDPREVSSKPAALILFNPAVNLDIPQIRERVTAGELEQLMKISPHQQLATALPPSIIFQGTADRIIPAESVDAFVEKARALGSVNIDYHRYAERGHEFYHGPGSRRDYKDTLEKVVGFLEKLNWL